VTQLEALALTIGMELPVAFVWFRLAGWLPRDAWWRGVLVVVAVSLISHPLAWQANDRWLRAWSLWPRVTVIELAVIVVEAAILAWGLSLAARRALVVSASMNAASFGLGVVLFYLRA
jgi:hypothetical protein